MHLRYAQGLKNIFTKFISNADVMNPERLLD